MRNRLYLLWHRVSASNLYASNRYVFIFGFFWGISALLVTVIVGLISQTDPRLPIEFVGPNQTVSHEFNITAAPTSAFICLGLSFLIAAGIYFY